MMKLDEGWVWQLFEETHWRGNREVWRPPVVDVYARNAAIGGELLSGLGSLVGWKEGGVDVRCVCSIHGARGSIGLQ